MSDADRRGLAGCNCVWISDDFVDTTECRIHPLTCEALHPETGRGCHHGPGHEGQHGYVDLFTWEDKETT